MDSNIPVIRAKYFLNDGFEGEMLIKNATGRGLGCRYGTAPMEAGDEIRIELPVLGLRTGTVRWTEGGDCGVLMAQPIDVNALEFRVEAFAPPAASTTGASAAHN